MTQACLMRYSRSYSDEYASEGVSQTAEELRQKPRQTALADISVTIGHRYSSLFHSIVDARAMAEQDDWDGDGAAAVSTIAVDAAIALSTALPHSLPIPQVQPETTGEITFEWRKDATHIAVLAVDGQYVRWSALAGADAPRSGAERYQKLLPLAALDVIREALG
jgi:hypothetical protein